MARLIHPLTSLKRSISPNLQSVHIPSLEYDDQSSENLNVLFLAYSDSLTSSYLSGITTATEEITASYPSVLGQKDALLQNIVLGGCFTANTLEGPFGAFSCLKHLQVELDKTTLTFSVFSSWSSLPSLTRLVIEMGRFCTFVHTGAELRDPSVKFKKLQDSRFAGPAPEILKMLRTMDESESLIAIELACLPGQNLDNFAEPLIDKLYTRMRSRVGVSQNPWDEDDNKGDPSQRHSFKICICLPAHGSNSLAEDEAQHYGERYRGW